MKINNMTQEEKAKAYDEALKRAKNLHKDAIDMEETLRAKQCEIIFPELKESEDERMLREIKSYIKEQGDKPTGLPNGTVAVSDMIAWLEKQGEFKSSKWTEGDVVRHGGVLALVTNGRNAMKSNCEKITIQYPDEWVKAEKKERRYFFEELEKQGEQDMIPLNKVIKFLDEQLVNDKDEVTGEPFINFQNYGAFKETFISYFKRKMLEKQGEQKPILDFKAKDWYVSKVDGKIYNIHHSVDRVEPKFKVGDWILYSGDHYEGVRHITKIDENGYYIERNGLPHGIIPFEHEICMRLWTIHDAKDGDVLASELCDSIILFKGIKDYNIDFYCDYDFSKIDIPGDRFSVNNGQHYGNIEDSKDFHPATKEQRDLLFQKMHEAGYKWDADKKELKKKIEQKPAWSEEDEKRFKNILSVLDVQVCWNGATGKKENPYQKEINWLKSLKDRVQPQPKQEWSEIDKNFMYDSLSNLTELKDRYGEGYGNVGKCIEWLNSIKQRIGG